MADRFRNTLTISQLDCPRPQGISTHKKTEPVFQCLRDTKIGLKLIVPFTECCTGKFLPSLIFVVERLTNIVVGRKCKSFSKWSISFPEADRPCLEYYSRNDSQMDNYRKVMVSHWSGMMPSCPNLDKWHFNSLEQVDARPSQQHAITIINVKYACMCVCM